MLSGVNIITLYDNDLVTKNDLLANEFTKKEDIDKYTLAQATQRGLSGINNSALIMTFKSNLFDNINLLNDFDIIIITNIIILNQAEMINNYCRNDKIFICNNCKNKYHKDHKSIKVNINNLSDGVKNYATTIQKEINFNLSDSKKYFDKFNNQNFTDANSRQERIKKKYDSLNELYNSIMEKLDFNDMDENKMNEYLQE